MVRATISGFFLAALLAVATGVLAPRADASETIAVAVPQPDAAAIRPGLSVKYYQDRFDHIDEVINASTWMKPVRGEPLPMLNYNVGAGPVLTNKNDDMVGAFIQGYIKIDKPGTYLFSVQHNDGVRVWIGNKMIYDAPFVAPDTWSPNIEVVAEDAGWYPVRMIYYEKKSTSTLELYWQGPGASSFEFVPASAFGHIPGEDDKTS